MTPGELAELLRDCPVAYHMAERGSWASIRENGLLSTSALLDLYGIGGAQRAAVECSRRPEKLALERDGLHRVVIRDQKPMDDAGLGRSLDDGLSPTDWYRLLNRRVFFWLTRGRLLRLLAARPYRNDEHDVLELDSAALVDAYHRTIALSPINSGVTRPFPQRRGLATFRSIADYPYAQWRGKRPVGERVVELTIDRGVPDIARFVRRVIVMRGGETMRMADGPPDPGS